MECKEVRKKLKEYAFNEIYVEDDLHAMEEHIAACVICKRELLLWQEVASKQKETMRLASYLEGDFRTRVKYRLARINSGATLPPAVRRLMSVQKAFTSEKGRLVLQLSLLLMGLIYFIFVLRKGTNIISLFFMIVGFGSLFFLVLKKKKK
jgi:hypothetical protein